MCFYKMFDWRKSLINFSYWTNLSEMKANVWEEEMNLIGQFFLIGSPGSILFYRNAISSIGRRPKSRFSPGTHNMGFIFRAMG